MDEHPDMEKDPKPQTPAKVVIPPPDLSRSVPPPPPSPLDSIAPTVAPPSPSVAPADPAVQVNLRTADEGSDQPASRLAPFNIRVIAILIDCAVTMGIIIGMKLILPDFADRLTWVGAIGYLLTRDALPFLGGQSVGKKAMKLVAVTRDGEPLTGKWEASIIRNLPLVIPIMPLVELFVLLSREDKPGRGYRLGDEWAKTKVLVEEEPPVAE
jgi:uncharacterized RDD family membrane protein YckC